MRLIDADALMKSITDWYCDPERCNSYHGVRCRACLLDDALNEIDSAPTVDGWISVKDKTPTPNSVCLIVFDPSKTCKQVMQVYVDYAGSYWRGNVQFIEGWVTHWMPLPEPPEG